MNDRVISGKLSCYYQLSTVYGIPAYLTQDTASSCFCSLLASLTAGRIESHALFITQIGSRENMMAYKGIGWSGFLLRLLAAFVLVFASYNPSGYSYYDWVVAQISSPTPWLALVGILLLIGWAIFLRATARSLGVIGLLLAAAFMGVLLWIMIDWGWFHADSLRAVTYIILVVLCWILAIGVSWSHIRRRITGQVDVDEVDGDL